MGGNDIIPFNEPMSVETVQGPFGNGGGGMAVAPVSGVLMGVDNRDSRMLAQSVPRNEARIRKSLCEEATSMKGAALYSWRVGDKNSKEGDGKTTIEGPSIKLAMAAARRYGNCVVIPVLQDRTPTSIVINAIFIDLETGFKVGRLFEQSIQSENFGKMDKARAMDMNFQIGQSKAIRNVICAAIPEYIIDEAMQAAKKSLIGDDPARMLSPDEMANIVKGFSKWHVTKEMLTHRIGRPVWNAADKAALTLIWQGISEGMTTVENEFPAPEKTPTENACAEPGSLEFGGEAEPSSRTKGTSSK